MVLYISPRLHGEVYGEVFVVPGVRRTVAGTEPNGVPVGVHPPKPAENRQYEKTTGIGHIEQ